MRTKWKVKTVHLKSRLWQRLTQVQVSAPSPDSIANAGKLPSSFLSPQPKQRTHRTQGFVKRLAAAPSPATTNTCEVTAVRWRRRLLGWEAWPARGETGGLGSGSLHSPCSPRPFSHRRPSRVLTSVEPTEMTDTGTECCPSPCSHVGGCVCPAFLGTEHCCPSDPCSRGPLPAVAEGEPGGLYSRNPAVGLTPECSVWT